MEEGLGVEGDGHGDDLVDQEAPDLAAPQPGSPSPKRLCLEYLGIAFSHDCCIYHHQYIIMHYNALALLNPRRLRFTPPFNIKDLKLSLGTWSSESSRDSTISMDNSSEVVTKIAGLYAERLMSDVILVVGKFKCLELLQGV